MIDIFRDRLERINCNLDILERLTEREVMEDQHHRDELQMQMMEYAYHHPNYKIFMEESFIYLKEFLLKKTGELIEGSIFDYHKIGDFENAVFCDLERYCMSLVIDEKPPKKERIRQIIRNLMYAKGFPF